MENTEITHLSYNIVFSQLSIIFYIILAISQIIT